MRLSGTNYCKEDFDELTAFDRICPKCQASEHTYEKHNRTFIIASVFSLNWHQEAKQCTYMCAACGSSWKGLPYSGTDAVYGTDRMVFMESASLYLHNLKVYEHCLKIWLILWFFIGAAIFF